MDFKLTEEQQLIEQSVREFMAERTEASVSDLMKSLAEMGFMGIFFDEDLGGAGSDFVSYIVTVQEIAKVSPSAALLYAINNTQAAYALNKFGAKAVQERYLPKIFGGEYIASYAYSEQGVGEDLLSIDAKAEKTDSGYKLNGTKTFVLNGGDSDLYIVYAQTEKGLSVFAVEGSAEGVSFSEPYTKMGLDGLPAATMTLTNVEIPAENLIGEEGQGAEIEREVRYLNNISIAAIAAAVSDKAMGMAISYGKERQQFRKPIINFEGLRVKVGEMASNIEAGKLLTYKAAALKDSGEDFTEAGTIARYFNLTTGENHVREAIQIHGGYGYTRDLGVEGLFRDMKGLNIFEQMDKPLVLQVADQAIK